MASLTMPEEYGPKCHWASASANHCRVSVCVKLSIVCNVRYCRNKTKVRWQVMYATRLISKALIRILHAKFHCNRLTTVQDIQDYASLIFGTQCSVSDWLDVWMSSIFFQLATPPAVLVRFSRNVAHTIYVPIRKKNLEQIFEILLLKSLEKFWNFTFGQAAAKAAAELSIYTVFPKKFTLLLFAITKSDVDRFQ